MLPQELGKPSMLLDLLCGCLAPQERPFYPIGTSSAAQVEGFEYLNTCLSLWIRVEGTGAGTWIHPRSLLTLLDGFWLWTCCSLVCPHLCVCTPRCSEWTLCRAWMNPSSPAPQLCRDCLEAVWQGVNVWQLSVRHPLGLQSGEVLGSSSQVSLLQSVEIRAQTDSSVEQKGDLLLVPASWT